MKYQNVVHWVSLSLAIGIYLMTSGWSKLEVITLIFGVYFLTWMIGSGIAGCYEELMEARERLRRKPGKVCNIDLLGNEPDEYVEETGKSFYL